ncbi:AGE family epimerase/isomerase [Nocardiopsis coralliicola]
MDRWVDRAGHRAWLRAEEFRLLDFGTAAALDGGGFCALDARGRPAGATAETWITGRMAHVYSLAHLRGVPGAGVLADHALDGLRGVLHDGEHGGWYAESAPGGGVPADSAKSAYVTAFVLLGSASATAAGRPGARDLLAEALATVTERFIEPATGLARESWDRAWTQAEEYRGANANMHLVEAFLAASGAIGDPSLAERALTIAEFTVQRATADNGWRLPEHFTPDWRVDPEYNADRPRDRFRPYGTTVGHWLEWARLLLELDEALGAGAPDWLLPAAQRLFDLSVEHGWAVDGADGFIYTLDWSDRPVVAERMHWVAAEAVLAAAALGRRTGEPRYEHWYRTWWDYIRRYLVDRAHGSWHHELDAENRPSTRVWEGKPDLYHAYQAVVLPTLTGAPAAAHLRDHPEES